MTPNRHWHAWLNLTPPKPDDFHVLGEVRVPNPGVTPLLLVREPQGANSQIRLMDLYLVQQAGMWPQVISWAVARYDRISGPTEQSPRRVHIFEDGHQIADLAVAHIGEMVEVEFKVETNAAAYQVWINRLEVPFENDKAKVRLEKGKEFSLRWRFVVLPGAKLTIKYKPKGEPEKTAVKDSEIPDYTLVPLGEVVS